MSGVRTFRQYLSSTGTAHYSDHKFCGECDRLLTTPYGIERTPEDLDERGSFPLDFGRPDRTFLHYAFCPWCGTTLEDEWWRETVVENERVVDHYDHPGKHKGDTHEFSGTSPDCFVGHYLSTNWSEVCWCKPTVEPSILGCRIIHNDVPRPQ